MLRDGRFLGRKAGVFTLQWHLTNACELHCLHCYDRTKLSVLSLEQARSIVQQMVDFCAEKEVRGQFCLAGGNPLLYKHFFELYQSIADAGFPCSILGNPTTDAQLDRLVEIQKPTFFQVSLEGLPEHNDKIRGVGYFDRVMDFLPKLRARGIRANVMLTLTKENIDQVIPLGELLRGHVDRFTFNRLAQVGEGANLELPSRERFVAFLQEYTAAAKKNPHFGFKENFFNTLRYHYKHRYTGGCTGFGCGAAFNFLALLPNGELHACRKFPSPVGDVHQSRLIDVYDSAASQSYRKGCKACSLCRLRNICGGCLAVTHGQGLDPLRDRDPHCFVRDRKRLLD